MSYEIYTDYLHKVYNPKEFKAVINKATNKIKEFRKKNKFDSIAFCGMSGASIAYPLSYNLGIPLTCIRKPGKNHFSNNRTYSLEGAINFNKYIIVDDFICSGNTVNKIIKTINKCSDNNTQLLGIYLFDKNLSESVYDNEFESIIGSIAIIN